MCVCTQEHMCRPEANLELRGLYNFTDCITKHKLEAVRDGRADVHCDYYKGTEAPFPS